RSGIAAQARRAIASIHSGGTVLAVSLRIERGAGNSRGPAAAACTSRSITDGIQLTGARISCRQHSRRHIKAIALAHGAKVTTDRRSEFIPLHFPSGSRVHIFIKCRTPSGAAILSGRRARLTFGISPLTTRTGKKIFVAVARPLGPSPQISDQRWIRR